MGAGTSSRIGRHGGNRAREDVPDVLGDATRVVIVFGGVIRLNDFPAWFTQCLLRPNFQRQPVSNVRFRPLSQEEKLFSTDGIRLLSDDRRAGCYRLTLPLRCRGLIEIDSRKGSGVHHVKSRRGGESDLFSTRIIAPEVREKNFVFQVVVFLPLKFLKEKVRLEEWYKRFPAISMFILTETVEPVFMRFA